MVISVLEIEFWVHDENLYFVDNDSCCIMKNKSINMRLYHKDGVHLNLSGSYKLAENIRITCKTKTPSQSNTQQKRHTGAKATSHQHQ